MWVINILFCCIIFFIDKDDGPIQVVVREGQRYIFSGVHGFISEDGQIRRDKVHEEKVRFVGKGKETEGDSSLEHSVPAREHNKDDRSVVR